MEKREVCLREQAKPARACRRRRPYLCRGVYVRHAEGVESTFRAERSHPLRICGQIDGKPGLPADLAVRSGPGLDHQAVVTVPGPYSDGDETYFPEVTITGPREGWFRNTEIITGLDGGLATEPVSTFWGEGWLPGNVLRLWVKSRHLWSKPIADAAITFTFNRAEGKSDYFRVDTLHACKGFWIEVEGIYFDKRPRGWTDDVCASQVTTCP